KELLYDDGYLLQEQYNNIWKKYGRGGNNNNWNTMGYFDGDAPLPDEIRDCDTFWKVTPANGMNYYTITPSDNGESYSSYPAGTKFRFSAWMYVDKNCDMQQKSARICGESMTPGSINYDFNKLGTWQFVSLNITSTSEGYYFLLYANTGYPTESD
ncbi:hypothetical protein V6O07_12645, partial [Arthrospira platensis SPKY2]